MLTAFPQSVQPEVKVGLDHLLPWGTRRKTRAQASPPDPGAQAENQPGPGKLTLGRQLQWGLEGDLVRGHEGPEVLEQLKGQGGAMSLGQGRGGMGEWCSGSRNPPPPTGLKHKGLLGAEGGEENGRRNERLSTPVVGPGSPEAWGRAWGSLYLLPVGVPQNVATHDVDDVWLRVHFAHQAAQALPEAGGGGAGSPAASSPGPRV